MSEEHLILTWDLIELNLPVIFISKAWEGLTIDGHPDVYGQCGIIRDFNSRSRRIWVTWEDPYYNSTYRGLDYWEEICNFAVASDEKINFIKDKILRQSHAMKFL